MTRPRRPVRRRALALAVVATFAAGCGTSGRDLQEVPPGQTAPPRTEQPGGSPTTVLDSTTTVVNAGALTLIAADFGGGEALPESATCAGEGVSPALTWANVPAGTVELALTVTDADDDTVHWAVTGIPAAEAGAPVGAAPPGAVVHAATDGEAAYAPVCPDEGDTRTIELTLYALDQPLALDDTASGSDVVAALEERASTGAAARTLLLGTAEG